MNHSQLRETIVKLLKIKTCRLFSQLVFETVPALDIRKMPLEFELKYYVDCLHFDKATLLQ